MLEASGLLCSAHWKPQERRYETSGKQSLVPGAVEQRDGRVASEVNGSRLRVEKLRQKAHADVYILLHRDLS